MGWKEIAACLRVSERTLKNNWRLWGVPIKLLPTKRGYKKPVITLSALKRWLAGLEDKSQGNLNATSSGRAPISKGQTSQIMSVIPKRVVYDESGKPVEVILPWEVYQEIEKAFSKTIRDVEVTEKELSTQE